MPLSVLHIDTEQGWRGGQNQLRLLLEHAPRGAWRWHAAVPPGSAASRRLVPLAEVFTLPMGGADQLTAAVRIAGYVRRHGIDVIDAHTGRAHTIGLLVRLFVPRCRLVVHRRVDLPAGSGLSRLLKYRSSRVDSYVAISERIAGVLRRGGVRDDRIAVVRSAGDAATFAALDRADCGRRRREEWGLDVATPIIGTVAHLSPEKDQATLLEALALLRDRGIDAFCFVAGDGPLARALRERAARLRLDERRLRFLGRRDDVPSLLAAADVFVLTSRQEGLGTSLLDAANAGCALAATDAGGMTEIVRDGETGLIAPAGDAEAVAGILATLVTDTARRDGLAAAARALAGGAFSVESMVQGNLDVYRRVAAAEPG
jgi:glycosyltransferase involved in cell wall biosynthesis